MSVDRSAVVKKVIGRDDVKSPQLKHSTKRFMKFSGLLAAVLLASGAVMTVSVPSAFAQGADAQTEPMKVLVGKLTGAKPTSARGWIVEGLENDSRFDVIPEDDSLSLPTGSAEHRIAEKAAELQADVVILGTSKISNGWMAQLSIYDGKTGALIEEVEVKGGSFKSYEDTLISGEAYFPVLLKAEGFPPPEPEPVEEEEEPVEEEPAQEEEPPAEEPEDDDSGRPSPLDASLGVGIYGRAFRYTDTVAQLGKPGAEPLVDYNLDAAPMPFVNVQWYPAAHFTGGWLAHIGISGGYGQGIATSVAYNDGATDYTYSQSHNLYYAGLRGRIPVAFATFGLKANYSGHSFGLKNKESGAADGSFPEAVFPNVSYSMIEMGADAEVRIGRVILGANGSYLLVLDSGDIGSAAWFPNTSTMGVHFGGHVGFEISSMFDVLAGVDIRAYGMDFNPIAPGTDDSKVAGGATDRYLTAFLALRFRLPGSESADAPAAAEAEGGGSLEFD